MKPCKNQHKNTWVCKYGVGKPGGECPPHTFIHRKMHKRGEYRSSIQCMIICQSTEGVNNA